LLASGPKPGASTNFAILAGICLETKAKGDLELKYGRPALPLMLALQLQPVILLDFSIERVDF
jgi:hypothetical protein